jgi:hypothetical protein
VLRTPPGGDGNATANTGPAQSHTLNWPVPLDGTATDLSASSVLDTGSGGAWGIVATAALIGLVVWTLIALGFILFVAKARRDRAVRQATPLD